MKISNFLRPLQNHWWGFALYAFCIFVFLDFTKWVPLRFWGATSGEHFVDTKQILNSVVCLDKKSNPYSSEFCTTFVYGKTLLRTLKFFFLNPSQTGLVGFVFLGLLSMVLGYAGFKSRISLITFNLVLFSPPIILLAERANFDVLMLALVVAASIMGMRDRRIFSTVFLGLASSFKFYTFPLMLITSLYTKKPFQRAIFILVTGFLAFQISKEISSSRSLMNPRGTISYNNGQGFGFNIWAGYLPRFKGIIPVDKTLIGLAFSAFILMIIGTAAFAVLRNKGYRALDSSVIDVGCYQLFEYLLIVHVSCYLAGVSIDYRLVFISIATLSYLGSTKSVDTGDFERKLLLGLLTVSLWCTYPSDGLQIIGDISLSVLTLILAINAARRRFHDRKKALK